MKHLHTFESFVNEGDMPFTFVSRLMKAAKGDFNGKPGVVFSSSMVANELKTNRKGPALKQLDRTLEAAGVKGLKYALTGNPNEVIVYAEDGNTSPTSDIQKWIDAAWISHPNADISKEGQDLLAQF